MADLITTLEQTKMCDTLLQGFKVAGVIDEAPTVEGSVLAIANAMAHQRQIASVASSCCTSEGLQNRMTTLVSSKYLVIIRKYCRG